MYAKMLDGHLHSLINETRELLMSNLYHEFAQFNDKITKFFKTWNFRKFNIIDWTRLMPDRIKFV